ncbi:MAG: N-formylglutamate deformylase [Rhodobacteraceae bacterium]|nr:N-formylglutamate deformylase [Paracoccaceae bacterium]
MTPVKVQSGNSPLILGQPHGGTYVPDDIQPLLNENGQGLADTDWHISKLYEGLVEDVTVVEATFHRYVIDANRDPAGASLYPGQNTTSLCPTTDFDGKPIWRDGHEPDAPETERRRLLFHAPYHDALANEVTRVKDIHGYAILFDCHSIRSDIPFLFEGTLPVFNTGTNNSETCDAAIEKTIVDVCLVAKPHSHVLNGRFKGGWTTRHYGKPSDSVHAIQMELAQRSYMHEMPPWDYAPERAAELRPHLKNMLSGLKEMNPSLLANS